VNCQLAEAGQQAAREAKALRIQMEEANVSSACSFGYFFVYTSTQNPKRDPKTLE
jgi:hypothetical protein